MEIRIKKLEFRTYGDFRFVLDNELEVFYMGIGETILSFPAEASNIENFRNGGHIDIDGEMCINWDHMAERAWIRNVYLNHGGSDTYQRYTALIDAIWSYATKGIDLRVQVVPDVRRSVFA